MDKLNIEGPVCPIPIHRRSRIVMGHGSGGTLTQELIRDIFAKHFRNEILLQNDDFGRISENVNSDWAISTDSHIVTPLFFPGGDIGRLAVSGTVNDVAMSGATVRYLSAGFILEEGLEISLLERVVASMQETAAEAGVQIIAGDTKVVERGKADQLFITTTGFGTVPKDAPRISGANAKPGDKIIVSGTIGDHGIAVLSARGVLGFEVDARSDNAPLNNMISQLLLRAPGVHVLRDPTRGGLATTLNEIAVQSNVEMLLDEPLIPVNVPVSAACEMLGFDPLYVANEGKVIVIVPENESDEALKALRATNYGANAAIIGTVEKHGNPLVLLKTPIGGTRILDVLTGEMLPRIC